MKIRTLFAATAALAMALAVPVVGAPLAHADDTTPGSFNTAAPQRIVDTRSGLGVGAPQRLGPRMSITFAATRGIVPEVGAVLLNVTAAGPTETGYLTVYAAGTPLPLASNVNFEKGQDVPNMVVTPVSAAGSVTVYNGSSTGSVDVVVDLFGYYVGGASTDEPGTLVAMASKRFLDTRIGLGAPRARVAANQTLTVTIAGTNDIPAGVSAVVANIAAVRPSGSGFVTGYAAVVPDPLVSHLNYKKGEDRANLALLAVDQETGTVKIFNGSKTAVDLLIDVTGYFVGGTPVADGSFLSSDSYRVFDSRGADGAPAPGKSVTKIQIFPAEDGPLFSDFFKAVVINVTAVAPERTGFLTIWDGSDPRPRVSSNNFRPGRNIASNTLVPVAQDGTISIYNGSVGAVDLVVDLNAYVLAQPAAEVTPDVQARRITRVLSAMEKFTTHPPAEPVTVTTG